MPLRLHDAPWRGEPLRTRIAGIGLWRLEVRPVRGRFGAFPDYRRDGCVDIACARFLQQRLDHGLSLVVIALAKLLVADSSLFIHKIERGPILVVKRAPDRCR